MLKMTLTIPKPNLRWYRSSKAELLKMVEEYNKEAWESKVDPVTKKPWAPRVQPTGSWPLLKKTGKMFGSTKFKAGMRTFDFSARIGVKYGGFHQRGTSKMVQRRWLGLGSDFDDKAMPIVKKHIFKGTVTFRTS